MPIVLGYSAALLFAADSLPLGPPIEVMLPKRFELSCSSSIGTESNYSIYLYNSEYSKNTIERNGNISIIEERDVVNVREGSTYFIHKYDASGYTGRNEIAVFNAEIDGRPGYYWRELTLENVFLHGYFLLDQRRVSERCTGEAAVRDLRN